MTSRTRLIITAVFVCHLIFAHSLVTSQLLAPEKSSSAEQAVPHIPDALKDEDVTILWDESMQGSDWTIGENTLPYTKKNANTVRFTVRVAAGQEVPVRYTVRWTY